ncbi:hypothetical protein C5167_025109 [Papaver somniferum]|uniref:Uncharacterized protein n=1 Tax=Papaver somniferum TaxID=3469 RepID=A0A4Y7JTS9_PAPSO|nr:hypothetical protein C5167_025109 [Papaver somniferum]
MEVPAAEETNRISTAW